VRRILLPLFLLVAAVLATPALAQSGHTNWNEWSFDWEVKDGAGLALRNVSYRNELVIWKASMPVIRVHYANNACGPYADLIDWFNLVPISWCGNNKVCQRSYVAGGHTMLEIGVEAHIGQYVLYQAWYLSRDGWIGAHLFSKGLQCQVDHEHHPYWRIDFDVNGFPADQVFVWDNNRPNQGWGQGWLKYKNELNTVKNPATGRVWFVRDNPTTHGVWILPGSGDGSADWFSTKDVAPRLYRHAEDQPWPFGASGHLGYDNNDDIQEKDDIVWYVAHMPHSASQGPSIWHSVGPWMLVKR
jgi:hypothetical protein